MVGSLGVEAGEVGEATGEEVKNRTNEVEVEKKHVVLCGRGFVDRINTPDLIRNRFTKFLMDTFAEMKLYTDVTIIN